MLAYASAFLGNPALIWPALGVALIGVVTGYLGRRAIRVAPGTVGGLAIATAGLLSAAAFLLLGAALVVLARGAGAG